MIRVALKMLLGAPEQYAMLISGICFSTILMVQGLALGIGVIQLNYALSTNVRAPIWVGTPLVASLGDNQPLRDTDVGRIRSVEGVAWAAPLFVGGAQARILDRGGLSKSVTLIGVDTATLAGAPTAMLAGSLQDLRMSDAVIVDESVLIRLSFDPKVPLKVGDTFEMNDRRARIVGVAETRQMGGGTAGSVFTTFDRATQYAPGQRKMVTFVLAAPMAGETAETVARRIEGATGLRAFTEGEFRASTVKWAVANTPVPFLVGIIVGIGFLVGTVISGQTFFTFIIENTRYFGVLRAMGTQTTRLAGMILVQAMVVGAIGYGLGVGLISVAVAFAPPTLPLVITWAALGASLVAVLGICGMAALLGIRRMASIEPAIVFRG
ncbi:MAG: ABC transporter permease [Opitutaceae bacterium]|jgi:putative ABC transport system permease protein